MTTPADSPLGPITPIRCTEPGCHWACHGVPDKYAESRARIVREHMAAEHAPQVLGTPTTDPAPETDEQRTDREETEREHAAGIHTHCGVTCEVDLPTERLRNFIIAKGYPGTKGALDELLRRAAASAPAAPADRATVLREAWNLAHEEGSRLEEVAGIEAARGARCVAHLLRRLADEAQPTEDENDDTLHTCPGRWGGPDCRCFDPEPVTAATEEPQP